MTDERRYAAIGAGERRPKATAGEAWAALADVVSNYADVLDAANNPLRAEWEMFKDDLAARSLAPWESVGLIDGPDGHLWGVERIA